MRTAQRTPCPPRLLVGVFDSGVGGLSVLKALQAQWSDADILYVADSGYAPYGEQPERYVISRALHITNFLRTQGAQLIIVACNTATAAAAKAIRQHHENLPIVGVEPGIKPAVLHSRSGRIGVMATTATLASEKFRQLVQACCRNTSIWLQPCPGLASAIENGRAGDPEISALIDRYTQPLRDAQVDTVALGCTHYPLVATHIQQALGPEVHLIDTADAVARHAVQLACSLAPASTNAVAGRVRLWTSAHRPSDIAQFAQQWLGLNLRAEVLPA